jgi:hypothetical protein
MPNAVRQAGFSNEQWVEKLRAGLEWCGACRAWFPAEQMSEDNPSRCRACGRKKRGARP